MIISNGKDIRLFLTDCDGCLTDGGMTISCRLVNPLHFPDKRDVLELVDLCMENRGWQQGCLSDSI